MIMYDNFGKNGDKGGSIGPSEELFDKIICRIDAERKLLNIKRRIIGLFICFAGSLAALVFSFESVQVSFIESGFVEFFSLIFSDAEIIASHSQSFALSLLETIPITGLIIFLTATLALLWSAEFLAKDLKYVFISTKLINNQNGHR